MSVPCECCVLSGRSLCDGLFPSPEESCRGECVNDYDRETLTIKWKFRPAVALPPLTLKFYVTAALPMLTSKLNYKTVIVNFVLVRLKPPTSISFIFTPHHPLPTYLFQKEERALTGLLQSGNSF